MKLLVAACVTSLSLFACTAQTSPEPSSSSDSALLDEGSDPAGDGTLHQDCFDACTKAKWGTERQCEAKCTY